MQERDLLMNNDLVERFLDGETNLEENNALAYAVARYFPHRDDVSLEEYPPEIRERVGYIVSSLSDRTMVDMWMYQAPGLPRFMANISRLEDGLTGFPTDTWILKDLDRIPVPPDLRQQWRKNDDRGGADALAMELGNLLRDRDFPQAGRMADRILGILLEATASGDDFPDEREKLVTWCTDIRATLREDAADLGLGIAPQEP
ncbi:MAG: hypothetical protein QG608_250 [Actinomycetota bacterium]|nr:hypothetical protein [Actinomycetota bacterium]